MWLIRRDCKSLTEIKTAHSPSYFGSLLNSLDDRSTVLGFAHYIGCLRTLDCDEETEQDTDGVSHLYAAEITQS